MGKSYQQLKFDGHLYVSGIDRSKEYEQIFKEPPVGLSILDIGCHMGYHILRAKREGAYYCMGIEKKKEWANKAMEVSIDLNLREFQVFNFDIINSVWNPNSQFDITLCLNFLHHLYPSEVGRLCSKINEWTKRKMVFIIWPPDGAYKDEVISIQGVIGHPLRTRISPRWFNNIWPDYEIESEPSLLSPERLIVKVTK